MGVLRVLVAAVAVAACVARARGLEVRTVASGFSWVENIRCDPTTGALFFTELNRGQLLKATKAADGSFNTAVHVNGSFVTMDGVAVNPSSGAIYVLASLPSQPFSSQLLLVDSKVPNSYKVVATTPQRGNGMALDFATNVLYITTEGLFWPTKGTVYAVDLNNGGAVAEVPAFKGGWSDDGAYIDQKRRLLYVSEVLPSKVLVYDLWAQSMNRTFKAQTEFLDDFTLSADGHYMYGASWGNDEVKIIDVESGEASVFVSDLTNPTSARWGCSDAFPPTSLFVTEGGSLDKKNTERKVVEVVGARQL